MALLRSLRNASPFSFRQHPRGTRFRYATFALVSVAVLWILYHWSSRRSRLSTFVPEEEEEEVIVTFAPEPTPEPTPEPIPQIPSIPSIPNIWQERATQVKDAFLHAYHGYEQYAFPHDELRPVTNGSIDNFNGWGVTTVDALSTILLMDLDDEFNRAIPMIRNTNFSLPVNTRVPFFETVIRYLGGLLSAYALSGNEMLRDKADELGTKLAPAFKSGSGLPQFAVNTYEGRNVMSWSAVLAEIASCQMEYTYLGKITGKKEHVDHATLITNILYNANLTGTGGMYPTHWDLNSGKPSGLALSIGGTADSGHEYTLKQFLLTAQTDRRNLEMYLRFTTHAINNLLYLSPERELLYATDSIRGSPTHKFEHLTCFFPGLLALGAHLLPLNNLETLGINMTALTDDLLPEHRQGYAHLAEFNLKDLHLWAAEGIAQTCYLTYADQPSGLGPESMQFDVNRQRGATRWMDALLEWKNKQGKMGIPPGVEDKAPWVENANANSNSKSTISERGPIPPRKDYSTLHASYLLRPETIESLYIMWRVTGDVKWRDRGWDIFEAIERSTKTPSGYASVDRVFQKTPILTESMPSYFLAETLKYLYLLFSDKDILPIDKWVFNTEAHPLPVFEWSQQEREAYGIL